MKYYIRTIKERKYELSSEEFDTREDAEKKINHMHHENRSKSDTIGIPNIKVGLKLFREGKYYKTIISELPDLWFLQGEINNKDNIPNPVRKEKLIDWYVTEKIDQIEEYDEEIVDRKIGG